MNFTKIWIIFFLFNLSFNFCNGSKSSNQPKAEKGKLDLSNWDFNKNTNSHSSGIVYLDGKWKFYWEQFCDPNKIILDSCNIVEENNLNEKYLSIPGNWVHQNYPSYGYATYLLNITLPDEHPELSLNMTDAGTAYSMYINGQLISKNGEVGKNEYESEPLLKHKIIDIKNFEGNELKILIHVSNFHHRKAGLWDRIQLGPSSSIHREDKQKSILNLLILSSLIIMGLYHLGFYFNRTKDISPLFFGILCLLFSLRTICMGDRFIMDIFPSIPFWIIHKLDYFSIFFSGFILLKFVQSLFPDEFSPKLGKILNFLFITLVLIVIFFSMKVYVYTIDPFQLIASFTILYTFKTTIKAIKNQRVGSILFLLGSLIFGSFIVNDILKTIGFIYTPYLANVGVLGFILFQPIILSRKFNHAFREIEELSETLETKISEGVKEQQRYNNCLLELANSKTIFEVGFDKAVEEITETCARIMKIDRCSIWIFNDRLNELECINLYNKKENFHSKGGILKSSDYPTYFEYIKMGVILSAPNINKHSNTFELKDTYSNPNNIYSLLNIPILSFGKQTGIISLEQTGKFQDWTGEEISFASSVSSIITNLFEIHQKENMYLDLQKTKQELEDLNKF
ncbi:MAG: hypothetical protein KDK36_07660, partial [Leptospiraceae bacterium]|nr:hypothetical protein [Leptospiraceae bacterium]